MTSGYKEESSSGWLQRTFEGIAGTIEQAVFTEEHTRKPGFLQRADPRAKLAMFMIVVLAAGFSKSLIVLVILYAALLLAARASLIPFGFFVKRVWLGIPFFAGIVIIPSIFFSPGARLFDLPLGPINIAPSIPGIAMAAVFVARVGVSVSASVLLVLTTPWADVLKSLRIFRVPQVFVLVLSMCYRYIFLFLHTANGMMEARRSRTVGRTSGTEQRRWIAGSMGALMSHSFKTSSDVYSAMLARGFTGQILTYVTYKMKPRDWASITLTLALGLSTFAIEKLV